VLLQRVRPAIGQWLATVGTTPDEDEETRLRTRLILMFAGAMSLGGLLWGTLSALFYESTAAVILPYGYTVLMRVDVTLFARARNFRLFRFIQLARSLLLPFLRMIAPLGALLVASRRQATR
jgi:hypothetical protein